MLIDNILYPVESLGPGKRVALWTVGCERRCPGCSNPELWVPRGQQPVTPGAVAAAIGELARENPVDGITITGGEPFCQGEDLLELVTLLRRLTPDLLVFTGYRQEELLQQPTAVAVLEQIAVLVDGAYEEARNVGLPLRGSSNQRILLFEPGLWQRYHAYLSTTEKRVQNFYFEDTIISAGIHDLDFSQALTARLREMHVRRKFHGDGEMA